MKNKIVVFLVCAVLLLALPLFAQYFGQGWVRILAIAMLYVLLALGLNIVVGYAGLLDLGFVAFYAVGAYMYALLASPHLSENFEWFAQMFPQGLHTPVWLVIPLAAGLAAIAGVLLGTPVLKLRGDYLAIVTLGFGEIIRIFLNNLNAPLNLTNGPQGITLIDPVRFGGVSLARTLDLGFVQLPSVYLYYYLFLLLTVITVIICIRLQDSRIGRAWMAIREDDIAAKAMGINVRNVKLLAFALGATFGGVSGAMFAAFQGFVSPESFALMESIIVLAMVVLGGLGHIPGALNVVSLDGTDGPSQKWLAEDRLAELYKSVPKDKTVYLYCHDGFRMSLGWVQLKSLGYRDVRVVNGGWGIWDRAFTLPVVMGEHPYDDEFAL